MSHWARALATLCILALPVLGSANEAVTEAGARFPTRIDAGGNELALAGTGVTKYRVVFTVSAVGLYVPKGTPPGAVLDADTPRRIEIEYFYDIPAEDIIKASMNVLNNQLTNAQLADQRSKIDEWHNAYKGVSEGDRYSMTYQPDRGTTLRLNGEPLITVEGPEFARTYFGIWLKANSPLSQSLRRSLLNPLTKQ